jgi:tetratricopeptide (TPR) repeat protein
MFLQTQHSGTTRFKVVEAVLATCASQPEFLPVSVPNDLDYVGPGLEASNPIHHVITEALCVDNPPPFIGRPRPHFITLLLSLGSGTPGMLPSIRRHHGHQAHPQRQQGVTQDEIARKSLEHADKDGTYFRFSLEQETQGRNLELDADELSRIATRLDLYLRNEDTVKRIEDSVSILINPDAAAEKVALTYYTKGLYDEAERIQGHVGQHRLLKLGNNHPSTIRARENLVMVFLEQCKWVEAEKEQLNLLKLQRAIHGTQHPRAIETAATLMAIYSEREDWEEAEELQLEILEQKRQMLGKDHLEAVRASATLASIYHMQGKWNEARQLGLEVLERRQGIFGEDHPDTILAAQCVDAISRAPKEAEAARHWTLNLAGAVEERVNSSLGAMVDAESDSSYPHTS